MFRWATPHYRVERVELLTPERLVQLGLRALLVDVDCTLKRYRSDEIPAGVADWVRGLVQEEIGFCLASNGGGRRIRRLAEGLGVPCLAKALKPFPFRLRRIVRQMGFPPEQTAMVGDQLFADIMAGRLAGLRTILVTPIHPEEEPWFTRLKRPAERLLLRRMEIPDGAAEPGQDPSSGLC
jgi:HAD superfamily phosphatase (TIGR01668 family)